MPTLSVSKELFRIEFDAADIESGGVVVDVCDLGFPIGTGPFETDEDTYDGESGFLGVIDLGLDNEAENFIDQFVERQLNNNSSVDSIVTYDFTASNLDLNGNGYVSAGDVLNLYQGIIGEIALAGTPLQGFDVDGDGSITVQDLIAALTYVGYTVPTGADPEPETYPLYLDQYPDDIAFACSLRKLKSDYEGPCMTVKLEFDVRQMNVLILNRLWTHYPSSSTIWQPQELRYEPFTGRDVFELRDQMYEAYPWMTENLEIGFTEDGYFDYEKIILLMDDPVEAFGIEMSFAEKEQFMALYKTSLGIYGYPNVNPKYSMWGAAAVTIQEWHDQSGRGASFKSTVTSGNESGLHPFSTSGLPIGWTFFSSSAAEYVEPIRKIVSYKGIPCIGTGVTNGLGNRPWEKNGGAFMADGNYFGYIKGWNCTAFPQTSWPSNSNDLINGWSPRFISDPTNSISPSTYYDVGMTYMQQDFNPFYEPDSSQWVFNTAGAVSQSKGKRTMFRTSFESDGGKPGNGHFRGGAIRGSFELGHTLLTESYLDNENDTGTGSSTDPYSANWSGNQIEGFGPTQWLSSKFQNELDSIVEDPVCSFAATMAYNEMSYHTFAFGGGYYAVHPVTPNTNEPATLTFTGGEGVGILLGVKQLFQTVGTPNEFRNTMEWIAWNDNLPESAADDYLIESRRYFSTKTINSENSIMS